MTQKGKRAVLERIIDLEDRYHAPLRDLLVEFAKEGYSMTSVAAEIGVNHRSIIPIIEYMGLREIFEKYPERRRLIGSPTTR